MPILQAKSVANYTTLRVCSDTKHTWNNLLLISLALIPILLVVGFVVNLLAFCLILRIGKRNMYYYYLKWIASLNIVTIIAYSVNTGVDIRIFIVSPFFTNRWILEVTSKLTLICVNALFKASIICLCVIVCARWHNLKRPHMQRLYETSQILLYLPYVIIVVCFILGSSSYFWYKIGSCARVPASERARRIWKHPVSGASLVNISADTSSAASNISIEYFKYPVLKKQRWLFYFDWAMVVLLTICPGILILFMGLAIAKILHKYYRRKNRILARNLAFPKKESVAIVVRVQRQWRSRLVKTRSILMVFAFYSVCMVPNIIVMLFHHQLDLIFSRNRNTIAGNIIIEVANILEAMYFCLSFLIYMKYDANFNLAFRRLCHPRRSGEANGGLLINMRIASPELSLSSTNDKLAT